MGIFDTSVNGAPLNESDIIQDQDLFMEGMLIDDILHMNDASREKFLQSEACQVLQEKGLISKKTHVGLSKADDLTRRRKMAVYLLARQKNDPLWKQFMKGRALANDAERKMTQRYASKANMNARMGQKEYLKITPVATTFF